MNHKTVKIAETRRIILHQSVANKCPHELRTATSVQTSIIAIYALFLHFSSDTPRHSVSQ